MNFSIELTQGYQGIWMFDELLIWLNQLVKYLQIHNVKKDER